MHIRTALCALIFPLVIVHTAHGAETATAPPAAAAAEGGVAGYGDAVAELIDRGMEFIGAPYRRGGSGGSGFDCSGLVQKVFRDALGFDLPRTARDMAAQGEKITPGELKPGDLVFFNTMRRAFSHVGIYLGDNRFLHSPSRGGRVRIEDITDSYWAKRFNGARRMIPDAMGVSPIADQP